MPVEYYQQKLPPTEFTIKLSLAEMEVARDPLSYNKEIERISKDQIKGKIVLTLLA